jgi:acyl transferase domain-containing protein
MIQKASIPKQASFVSLNPRIPALAPDKMEIATMTQAWDSDFKSVCINNYGAAGSNAVLIVCQPPPRPLASSAVLKPSSKELIAISANSAESLKLCCSSLQELINSHTRKEKETQDKLWLASLAFNLAHKQNHMLQHKFISSSRSSSDLWSQLEEVKMGSQSQILKIPADPSFSVSEGRRA